MTSAGTVLGKDHDTAEFAGENIRRWWRTMGLQDISRDNPQPHPGSPGAGRQGGRESGTIHAPILTALPEWMLQKLGLGPDDAPKLTYSGLGALRSRFIPGGNLGQLEHASVPA